MQHSSACSRGNGQRTNFSLDLTKPMLRPCTGHGCILPSICGWRRRWRARAVVRTQGRLLQLHGGSCDRGAGFCIAEARAHSSAQRTHHEQRCWPKCVFRRRHMYRQCWLLFDPLEHMLRNLTFLPLHAYLMAGVQSRQYSRPHRTSRCAMPPCQFKDLGVLNE